jgi:hypothetical protein
MANTKITGGCHHGALRYKAEVDPEPAGICHCKDCGIDQRQALRPAGQSWMRSQLP